MKLLIFVFCLAMVSSNVHANEVVEIDTSSLDMSKEIVHRGSEDQTMTLKDLVAYNGTDFDLIRTKYLSILAASKGFEIVATRFSYLAKESNNNGLPDELISIPFGLAADAVKQLVFYNQYGRYKSVIELDVLTPAGTKERCVAYGAHFISSTQKQNNILEISLGEPSIKGSANHAWGSSHAICDKLLKSININSSTDILIN